MPTSDFEKVHRVLSLLAEVLAKGLSREQRRMVVKDLPLSKGLRDSMDEYGVFDVLRKSYSETKSLEFAVTLTDRISGTRSFYQDVGVDLDTLRGLLNALQVGRADKDPPCVFALLPLNERFLTVYEGGTRPALETLGCRVSHAQDTKSIDRIIDTIFAEINRARFLVADVTGRNANVFYELGYAHALGKRVILVVQDIKDVPFDTASIRHIIYAPASMNLYRTELTAVAKTLLDSDHKS